jgi:hypothetical protein
LELISGTVYLGTAQRKMLRTILIKPHVQVRPNLLSIYRYISRSRNTNSHLIAGYTSNYDFDTIAYNNTLILFSGQYKHPAFLSLRFVQAASLLPAFALRSLFYRNSLSRTVLRGGFAAFHGLGRDLVNFDR